MSLIKLSWDGDYEEKGRYGIAANRMIGSNPNVHDMLTKALKDKNVIVTVDEFDSDTNLKQLKGRLKEIRTKIGPNKSLEQHKKDYTNDWHRGHSYGIGMNLSNEMLKGQRNVHSYILDYVNKNHIK